jgi:hypothetical protein
MHFIGRKLAFRKYVEHLSPDIAGSPDDCDLVSHGKPSFSAAGF